MPFDIGPAIGLATEVLKLLNLKTATKWQDELTEKQLEISEEKGKGQLSDDAKIESLEREINIIFTRARDEVAALNAKK